MNPQTSDPRRARTGAKSSGAGRNDSTSWVRPPDDGTDSAEAAVLGAMILSVEARIGALELLSAADFDRPAHRVVFEAVSALHHDGVPVDPVTVNDRLAASGRLDEVGGLGAVYGLTALEGCPVPASWPTYATIVAREARRRRGITVLRRALARLEAGEDPAVVAADLAVAT
jgi:replicative DNA helicase